MINNKLFFRHSRKLHLPRGISQQDHQIAIDSLEKQLNHLGFCMSESLIQGFQTLSNYQFNEYSLKLLKIIENFLGIHLNYQPMYPNFPKQVKEISTLTLRKNALLHYYGDYLGVRILPHTLKSPRVPLKQPVSLTTISLGTEEEYYNIFTHLLASKVALSSQQHEYLNEFFQDNKENVIQWIPDQIPVKENLAIIVALFLEYKLSIDIFKKNYIKTATDILRILTAYAEGDVSLKEHIKFRKLSRPQRKAILDLLENSTSNIIEDFLSYKNRWKRIGEVLHPFEYQNRFPKCYEAFDIIRNNKHYQTFNQKIEQAIKHKDIFDLISLLSQRPGEFARRLDHILRLSCKNEQELCLLEFSKIAHQISSTVLLQLKTHFSNRSNQKFLRVFYPKGNINLLWAQQNNFLPLNSQLCNQVIQICDQALIHQFSKKECLGKCWIDPALTNYTIPSALRAASRAIKTIPKNSKIPLSTHNILRFFIYWKDGVDRTDLDLSAVALDEKHHIIDTIAYYNLKNFGGYHSGDITSAPEGASEFIDIDIQKFLEKKIRYVMMVVNSFTQQPYYELPVCFAGFMERKCANSGEIYEPTTVSNQFDLTANTRIAIPMVFDLKKREMLWADLSLTHLNYEVNNVENHKYSLSLVNKALYSTIKPNLYDLFLLHIKARGQQVDKIEQADTIFSINDGIKPTDIDILVSEYL